MNWLTPTKARHVLFSLELCHLRASAAENRAYSQLAIRKEKALLLATVQALAAKGDAVAEVFRLFDPLSREQQKFVYWLWPDAACDARSFYGYATLSTDRLMNFSPQLMRRAYLFGIESPNSHDFWRETEALIERRRGRVASTAEPPQFDDIDLAWRFRAFSYRETALKLLMRAQSGETKQFTRADALALSAHAIEAVLATGALLIDDFENLGTPELQSACGQRGWRTEASLERRHERYVAGEIMWINTVIKRMTKTKG